MILITFVHLWRYIQQRASTAPQQQDVVHPVCPLETMWGYSKCADPDCRRSGELWARQLHVAAEGFEDVAPGGVRSQVE